LNLLPTNRDRFKGKGKKNQKPNYAKQQNKFSNKIQKPKGLCYVYGKPRHKAYQCPLRKGKAQLNRKPIAQANLTEDVEIICAVVEEANLVAYNAEWIYDTGALRDFYANKELI